MRPTKYRLRPGEKFGRWTVLAKGDASGTWRCRCDCGRVADKSASQLVRGSATRCIDCRYPPRLRRICADCGGKCNKNSTRCFPCACLRRRLDKWDRWLDGDLHRLQAGVDFTSSVECFTKSLRIAAERRGLRVSTMREKQPCAHCGAGRAGDVVIIRALPQVPRLRRAA